MKLARLWALRMLSCCTEYRKTLNSMLNIGDPFSNVAVCVDGNLPELVVFDIPKREGLLCQRPGFGDVHVTFLRV